MDRHTTLEEYLEEQERRDMMRVFGQEDYLSAASSFELLNDVEGMLGTHDFRPVFGIELLETEAQEPARDTTKRGPTVLSQPEMSQSQHKQLATINLPERIPIGRNNVIQQNRRNDNTIPKVIFTQFKYMLQDCSVDFKGYFQIIPYEKNQRSLTDFYFVLRWVQQLDKADPGTMPRFLELLSEKKAVLREIGRRKYEGDENREKTYQDYLTRVYRMFECLGSNDQKLRTLYGVTPAFRFRKDTLKHIRDFETDVQAIR